LGAEDERFSRRGGSSAGESFPDGGAVVDGGVGRVEGEGAGGVVVEGVEGGGGVLVFAGGGGEDAAVGGWVVVVAGPSFHGGGCEVDVVVVLGEVEVPWEGVEFYAFLGGRR